MSNPVTASVKAVINAELKRVAAAVSGGLGGLLSDAFDKIDGLAALLAIVDAFGWDEATTTGLTFGYKAGLAHTGDGTLVEVAAGTVALTDDAVNYVQLNVGTGVVSAETTNEWVAGNLPLWEVTTVGGSIPVENVADFRPWFGVLGAGVVLPEHLADEIADVLHSITFTVGTEGGNAILVTGQVKDIQGNNLSDKRLVEVWVADAVDGWECAAAPSGGWTVETGTDFGVITADKRRRVLSNASGVFALEITQTGAKTFYVGARIGGLTWYSGAVTFAA